ncbi:MAG TPA: patatin-like phospholipase family protein [Bryobacteraceae bacterium]|nr:patatin-like phospholipase family protein [Bryobacteraceae bacterium]
MSAAESGANRYAGIRVFFGRGNGMDEGWVFEAARRAGVLGGLRPRIRIGLALGGGFARGIAHAGVLKVLERHHVLIHCITGVSAGSIVAAAYSSGATPHEIARAGCSMRFGDVGRWNLGRLGLARSERMIRFLERLLRAHRFEEMFIPLGVLATDLATGQPVPFYGTGRVFEPIRASCSYPGLFQPVRHRGQLLVDGAVSTEVPAALARQLGATHVVSVHLPGDDSGAQPSNLFQVVNRCFQILQSRSQDNWRSETDLVIAPNVCRVGWDAFGRGPELIEAGEAAALAALPQIEEWFGRVQPFAPAGAA